MVRLAIIIVVLAVLVWFGGVYKLGDKTLAAHLDEVYRSNVVQKKLDQLHKGFDDTLDDFAVERSKKETTQRRVQARAQEPKPVPAKQAPMSAPEPRDVRPAEGQPKKTPPTDALTDDDRDALNKLVADKLKR